MTHHEKQYLPAAGRDLFLPLYDPLTTVLGLGKIRRQLVDQARLQPKQRVLDVGCGTGTLLVLLKRRYPEIEAIGIDPDPRALERAKRKARRAQVRVHFERGFADSLACETASFDRVLSSFMFHHLEGDAKLATLRQVQRVLKPYGCFEMVDFAGGERAESLGLHHWVHSHARLADNDRQRVIALMAEAGLRDPRVVDERVTWFGTIVQYRATSAAKVIDDSCPC
jgi:ubiquinone/menaquinone biosynthesis C-methylase UbiE